MKCVSIDSKLGEIFSLPIPDKTKCHYFVIIAIIQDIQRCLLVNFSSIKNGEYYDKSCIFDKNDNICFENGSPLINRKSCIRYDKAIELNYSDLQSEESIYCTTLDEDSLNRIIEGAKVSPDMSKPLKIMYNLTEKKKVILRRKLVLQNQR